MTGRRTLDYLVLAAAAASGLVAAWLFVVTRTVLPARDPSMIVPWTVVALGYAGYAGLTAAYVVAWPRTRSLRWLVVGLSVLAVGLSGYLLITVLTRTGHFEGYLLLMGAVLGGHAVTVLVRELSVTADPRRLAAGR